MDAFDRHRQSRQGTRDLGALFDRLPPHSIEAEMSLLGSMILEPQVIADVITRVHKPEAFYNEAHGAIFQSLIEIYDQHHSGDLVQLVDALRERRLLDDIGGEDYLIRLAEAVPSATNAIHYARIVAEKYKVRRLIAAAGDILYKAYHVADLGPDGSQEVLDQAESQVFEIAGEESTNDPQRLGDLLQIEIDRLETAEGVTGVRTGYDDLDDKLGGMRPGEFIIVAARPSMGKTALALNLAEQIAFGGRTPSPGQRVEESWPVAVFSLEMSKAAVTQRLLSACSQVDMHRMRNGHLSDEEFRDLMEACSLLGDAPIYIDDTPGMTVMTLRARARRLVAQQNIKAIMIDYLQLLTSPSAARESRQVEVATISRNIKALARELSVPIVCLAQLNRGTEQREGNRPRMSDLRESGSIEQDADVVLLLHREEYYHINNPAWAEEHPEKVGLAELIVAKQRNGPTGVVKLTWDNKTTRFKSHIDTENDDYSSLEPKAFSPGRKAGPVAGFRDGGGPDIGDLPV